ncbi:hypothetical protein Patl1_25205 [Pistacia atlantica]|uniref:Uncharacterized protein n=1 Tax=Pistacia atlantica TaxID=434234 RepID=A0ACC1B4K8_9ROSI|nr:hypothetical protein Patl1_25205 [Pistacia atlantica]
MTPHKEWFCEYETYNGGNVLLGDDTAVKIIGRGKIRLRLHDGLVRKLPEVMHIPGMSRNLLFVGTMADTGIVFNCDRTSCKMTRGSMVIARGVRHGTLYRLQASVVRNSSLGGYVSEKEAEKELDSATLWHQRMGHIGESALSTLVTQNMAEGIPNCSISFGFCEECL